MARRPRDRPPPARGARRPAAEALVRRRIWSSLLAAAGAIALVTAGAVLTPLGQRAVDRFLPAGGAGPSSTAASTGAAASPAASSSGVASSTTMSAAVGIAGSSTDGTSIQGDVLAITAVHVVGNVCTGSPGWRVRLDRKHLGAVPGFDDVYVWARRHGGAEVSGSHVTLTLQGLADTVTVTDIRIDVVRTTAAVPGTHIVPYGECGGTAAKHFLVAKLDDVPPQVYTGTPELQPNDRQSVIQGDGRFFDTNTVRLIRAETEVFEVFAYAHKLDYAWRIAIHWTGPDGGRHVTHVDDAGGQPFVTVPRPPGDAWSSAPDPNGDPTWRIGKALHDE